MLTDFVGRQIPRIDPRSMNADIIENITSAITNGRTDIVRALVTICEKGDFAIDGFNQNLTTSGFLNSISNEHGTLLHLATKLQHVDIVRTLLTSGADPSVLSPDGRTAYELAETDGMLSAYTEELLKCSARSDIDRIDQLLSAGVPIDSIDSPTSGNTALHWAASFGTDRAVKYLIEQGAPVNVRNSSGSTPLHDAVLRKDLNLIKVLLEAGADASLKCSHGKNKNKTAIDMCNGNEEILNLLKAYCSPSTQGKKLNNEDTSTGSCSLESLRMENGLPEHLGRLSLVSLDDVAKPDAPLFASPACRPIPHLSSPLPLVTDSRLYQLWPLPHEIIQTDGSSFRFHDKCSVFIAQDFAELAVDDVIKVWQSHIEEFMLFGFKCVIENVVTCCLPSSGRIMCHVNERTFDREQCYKIIITSEQIKILAADILGLHYSLCTLKQLVKLYKDDEGIPPLYIKDWPICIYRAVLLDMVPGARKPNMETLRHHIKIWSSLKMNQIHFYFRFDPKVGNKWPYSNSDLISISSYCRQHRIEPVPSLDVSSECSYEDICKHLLPLQELMLLFCSREFHIGPYLSRLLFDALLNGKNPNKAWDLILHPSSRLIYMCINGHATDEKLLQSLPPNAILIEYGYQDDYNYDASLKPVTIAGFPVIVGVGTCSWGSIAGSPETAVTSIHKAAQSAAFHNALGMIVADWKSMPHHCAPVFSWPGVLLTAGLSWNSSIHVDFLHVHLPTLMDSCVFLDSEKFLGRLTFELGRLEAFIHRSAHDQCTFSSNATPQIPSSILHRILVDADNVRLDHLNMDVFQQAVRHLKRFENDLQKAKPSCFQKGEVVAELHLTIDLMVFACRVAKALVSNGLNPFDCGVTVVNAGVSNLLPTVKTDLANKLLAIVEQFRGVWLSRNLPCGLHTSLYLFNSLLHKFIPDSEQYFSSADGFLRQ